MVSTDVPHEFQRLVTDFVTDIKVAFPEFQHIVSKYDLQNLSNLYLHCKRIFSNHYDDILCRNDAIFSENSKSTEFLPGISFSFIWQYADLNETHRDMIWNYLQMVMITVIERDEINQDDQFQSKLQETVEQLRINFQQHKPVQFDEKLEGFMNTKLANIAKEIAQETTENFQGLDDIKDVNSVFETLFKDPKTLMGIVKNVNDKLEQKMNSGELSESDLMSEANSMIDKFKDIPAFGNIQEILKNMNNQQQDVQQKKTKKKTKGQEKEKDQDKMLDELFKQLL